MHDHLPVDIPLRNALNHDGSLVRAKLLNLNFFADHPSHHPTIQEAAQQHRWLFVEKLDSRQHCPRGLTHLPGICIILLF